MDDTARTYQAEVDRMTSLIERYVEELKCSPDPETARWLRRTL